MSEEDRRAAAALLHDASTGRVHAAGHAIQHLMNHGLAHASQHELIHLVRTFPGGICCIVIERQIVAQARGQLDVPEFVLFDEYFAPPHQN